MERPPKNLCCWPRGCSAAACELWNQQGGCQSSQRMWHEVEGNKMPARDPLPSVDVTSALAGSLPTGIS